MKLKTETPRGRTRMENVVYCLPEFSVSRVHRPHFFLHKCLKMQNDPRDQMWGFLLRTESRHGKFCSKKVNVLVYIQLMAIEIESITPVAFIQSKTNPSRFLASPEPIERGSRVFWRLNRLLSWKAKPNPSLRSELMLEFFKEAIAGVMGDGGCHQLEG